MHTTANNHYDVAILGTGMSGTVLGTILVKNGVRVIMLDPKTHPRFAIGESTIPHTSLLMSILAQRYNVPELDYLAYPDRIAKHICTTCGIKRSFGFAYHRPGRPYNVHEALQFGTSSKDENHLFRQDTDAYFVHVAIRHGAVVRQGCAAHRVEINDDLVTLKTTDGDTIHAKYLVDASGFKSFLAGVLGMHETPTRIRHHSRSLYTHMIDVRPFAEEGNPFTLSWQKSTLHHVFDGGWIWVIPFNNQPTSTNPLVSVGMTVDPRKHPRRYEDPELEFRNFIQQFPSVAEQFADAKAVRPWTATSDRVQYSTSRCVGYRYCLMSHAAGFVDALYSRGLINTYEIIYALLPPLLRAVQTDDFSPEHFEHIERIQRRVLDYNDRLVCGSYASWSDFDLFNAWLRVWALGTIMTEFRVMDALMQYTATHDLSHLDGGVADPAFSNYEDPDYKTFFNRATALMDEHVAGQMDARTTADRILAAANDYEFPVMLTVEAMRRAGWMADDRAMSPRNLEFARKGYRWAITNPTSRDLFGSVETFYRWRAKHPDPFLT